MKKLMILMTALMLTLALAACGTAADTASEPADPAVMTHAAFLAAEVDAPVTVETFVQAKQSYWEGKASFYTQAEDGAYFIYQMPCTEAEYAALVPGTAIRVTGKKAVWSGEIEIADATFEVIDGSFTATALDANVLLGTDALAARQNELAAFKGATVVATTDADGKEAAVLYNWDGKGEKGSDLYFDATVNGQKVTFTVESDLCGADTAVYQTVEALKVGDVIDLTCFLYWYNDGPNPHVTAVTAAE